MAVCDQYAACLLGKMDPLVYKLGNGISVGGRNTVLPAQRFPLLLQLVSSFFGDSYFICELKSVSIIGPEDGPNGTHLNTGHDLDLPVPLPPEICCDDRTLARGTFSILRVTAAESHSVKERPCV